MGVMVFDQESGNRVEVFCDNDPLMPKDVLPFEMPAGPDRCDEYILGDRPIDRKHPDHVCGVTAQESVNRFRTALYGHLKMQLPFSVWTAWPMPIGEESIRALASRHGVDPLCMLPALTELENAWIAMVVRRTVFLHDQPMGWIRLYGLVEREAANEDAEGAGTVWKYGPPRVTVEYSKRLSSETDSAADTARNLWDWHTKNILHQPLSGSGRPRGSGTHGDCEQIREKVLTAIRARRELRARYRRQDIAEDLYIRDASDLGKLLRGCHTTFTELKRSVENDLAPF